MIYQNTERAVFLDRPNRFIAHVRLNGAEETVHVKNTGRCAELLLPGAEVVLQRSDTPGRKTKYDLIAAYKRRFGWVNIDSQAPNRVMAEWLETQGYDKIQPEYRRGGSRLDFFLERRGERTLLEVKGCTLEIDGIGYFPDAPSVRASRHCRELARAAREGYRCVIAFVIAMEGVDQLRPNGRRDPDFARALSEAVTAGVKIWRLPCAVGERELRIVGCEK